VLDVGTDITPSDTRYPVIGAPLSFGTCHETANFPSTSFARAFGATGFVKYVLETIRGAEDTVLSIALTVMRYFVPGTSFEKT
jgi:hypothetical protein